MLGTHSQYSDMALAGDDSSSDSYSSKNNNFMDLSYEVEKAALQ